jgi:hypothetical protein
MTTRKALEAATRIADEMADEMRHKLQDATPEDLGYPGMTADELVASEWRCWFKQELAFEQGGMAQ